MELVMVMLAAALLDAAALRWGRDSRPAATDDHAARPSSYRSL